jgi:hypothetical protein
MRSSFFPRRFWVRLCLKRCVPCCPQSAIVIPVGGVDANQVAPWMAAGALGLGVGSSVYKPGDDARIVEAKARALVAAVRAYKSEGESSHEKKSIPPFPGRHRDGGGVRTLPAYAVPLPKMKITRVRAYCLQIPTRCSTRATWWSRSRPTQESPASARAARRIHCRNPPGG